MQDVPTKSSTKIQKLRGTLYYDQGKRASLRLLDAAARCNLIRWRLSLLPHSPIRKGKLTFSSQKTDKILHSHTVGKPSKKSHLCKSNALRLFSLVVLKRAHVIFSPRWMIFKHCGHSRFFCKSTTGNFLLIGKVNKLPLPFFSASAKLGLARAVERGGSQRIFFPNALERRVAPH